MTKRIRPIFKCFGGKFYLAKWIISHFPKNYENLNYIEPYCGAASVYFNSEHFSKVILNDINPDIYNLLTVIRDNIVDFKDRLQHWSYNKNNFEKAKYDKAFELNLIQKAVNEYAIRRMSRAGLGKDFAHSERLRGGMPEGKNAWRTAFSLLDTWSQMLKGVEINCLDATALINFEANANTLIYADPPYFWKTRVTKNAYLYEMDDKQHENLAKVLNYTNAKVVLSGYDSEQYREWYKHWRMEKKVIPNHSGQTKKKNMRTECIWMNY